MTIQLQGIGRKDAIEAKDLAVGMVITWNYGYKSEVMGIQASKSGKTLTVSLRNERGEIRERKMAATKLIAAK